MITSVSSSIVKRLRRLLVANVGRMSVMEDAEIAQLALTTGTACHVRPTKDGQTLTNWRRPIDNRGHARLDAHLATKQSQQIHLNVHPIPSNLYLVPRLVTISTSHLFPTRIRGTYLRLISPSALMASPGFLPRTEVFASMAQGMVSFSLRNTC